MSELTPITVLRPHFAVVALAGTGELQVVRSVRAPRPLQVTRPAPVAPATLVVA